MLDSKEAFSVLSQFEPDKIADSDIALAYESCPAKFRAHMKLNVARQLSYCSPLVEKKQTSLEFSSAFGITEKEVPAPFSLYICDANYPYPTALLAALIPSICAGVPRNIVLLLTEKEQPTSLSLEHEEEKEHWLGSYEQSKKRLDRSELFLPSLHFNAALGCALDLAGCDDIYYGDSVLAQKMMHTLNQSLGVGRLIFLSELSIEKNIALECVHLHIPLKNYCCSPFYVTKDQTASLQNNNEPLHKGTHFSQQQKRETSSICVDLAHEQVWFWPDLPPSWFKNKHISIYSTAHAE